MNRSWLQRQLDGIRPTFPDRLYKGLLIALVIAIFLAPLSVWFGLRITNIPFLNGMAIQASGRAQSLAPELTTGIVTLAAPVGSVARGVVPYPYANDPEGAARELTNPLPRTMANLKRGEWNYDIYCQVCHGYKGMGNGSATGPGRLPAANSLVAEKVRNQSDGHIFHIITAGQNTMPGYARQIAPLDRWDIVNYVRALQRAAMPTADDLATSTTAPASDDATTASEADQ